MTLYALIADSDATRASTYATIMREEGMTPLIVRDGLAASAALAERGAPALSIVELSLTPSGGFDLIERIRRVAPATKSPLIAVSDQRELREGATERRERLGIGAILAHAASAESVARVVRVLVTSLSEGDTISRPSETARPDTASPDTDADSSVWRWKQPQVKSRQRV